MKCHILFEIVENKINVQTNELTVFLHLANILLLWILSIVLNITDDIK